MRLPFPLRWLRTSRSSGAHRTGSRPAFTGRLAPRRRAGGRHWAWLLVAACPAAWAAPLTLDLTLANGSHRRLHHGVYIDLWVDTSPYVASLSFDDTVSLIDSTATSRRYRIGTPGSAVRTPSPWGWAGALPRYESWLEQDWSTGVLRTTFNQTGSWIEEGDGETTRGSYGLHLIYLTSGSPGSELDTQGLRRLFTSLVGTAAQESYFHYAARSATDGWTLWDESFSGAVYNIVGVHAIPEPGSVALMLGGLAALCAPRGIRRRGAVA